MAVASLWILCILFTVGVVSFTKAYTLGKMQRRVIPYMLKTDVKIQAPSKKVGRCWEVQTISFLIWSFKHFQYCWSNSTRWNLFLLGFSILNDSLATALRPNTICTIFQRSIYRNILWSPTVTFSPRFVLLQKKVRLGGALESCDRVGMLTTSLVRLQKHDRSSPKKMIKSFINLTFQQHLWHSH